MERLLTFTDVDENRLELRLKPDRIQLVVIDSRPELEAGELRRFAAALFAEYVGRDLGARLNAAKLRVHDARLRARSAELIDALDRAQAALGELSDALAVPVPVPLAIEADTETEADEIDGDDADAARSAPHPDAPAPRPPRVLTGLVPYLPLKQSRRGKRLQEDATLRWHAASSLPLPPR